MNVPDNQKIGIFHNNMPVGLVYSQLDKPDMLGGEIVTMSFHGTCLGEEIHAGSIKEVTQQAKRIGAERKLRHFHCGDGAEVTTLYTPAFEE